MNFSNFYGRGIISGSHQYQDNMKIIINENKLLLIRENEEKEEVTFYKFFTEVKNFLKKLLDDPIGAKPSDFFKDNGISKNDLLNKMLERGIIKKKENIDEPNDADGKMKSMHYLSYSIPKKDFEHKIKRLYSHFFENKITESIGTDVRPQQYNSVAVYIFCKDEEGRIYVLAGKRRGYNDGGSYNVPTGQVGDKIFDETVEDAAVREVREESGIIIDKSSLRDLGDEEYQSRYGYFIGKNFLTVLNGTIENNQPGRGDGENEPFQWIPIEAVSCIPWAFGQNKHIYNIVNTI